MTSQVLIELSGCLGLPLQVPISASLLLGVGLQPLLAMSPSLSMGGVLGDSSSKCSSICSAMSGFSDKIRLATATMSSRAVGGGFPPPFGVGIGVVRMVRNLLIF